MLYDLHSIHIILNRYIFPIHSIFKFVRSLSRAHSLSFSFSFYFRLIEAVRIGIHKHTNFIRNMNFLACFAKNMKNTKEQSGKKSSNNNKTCKCNLNKRNRRKKISINIFISSAFSHRSFCIHLYTWYTYTHNHIGTERKGEENSNKLTMKICYFRVNGNSHAHRLQHHETATPSEHRDSNEK